MKIKNPGVFKNFIPYVVDPGLMSVLQVLSDMMIRDDLRLAEEGDILFPWQLAQAHDPASTSWRSIGLVPPLTSREELLVEVSIGTFVTAIQINERMLPAKVRDEQVLRRVGSLEEREGRKVGRKEYAELREEVEVELLPRAFIRRTVVPVMFVSPYHMFVFTSSVKRADDAVAHLLPLLRHARVRPVTPRLHTDAVLRSLALDPHHEEFIQATDNAVLRGPDGAVVRVKDKDIHDPDIAELLISESYTPKQLGVAFFDEDGGTLLTATVDENLQVRRAAFPDLDLSVDDDADHCAVQQAAMILVAQSYRDFINALVVAVDGDIACMQIEEQQAEGQSDDEDEDDEL